jgi:predicted glycoside hydrolase/deacetylase ChbG (UPF0249 family)
MSQRLLIVNADDFGLTSGICRGILDAHRNGIVTSTSVLAVGPALADHVDALRASGLGIGAHLAAVGEDPPVLSADEVPSLVDRSGRFPLTWKDFLVRAIRGQVDPADLDREFAAQVMVLRDAGLDLTHVDAHQNLHLWPTVTERVVELAQRERIRAIRVPRSWQWSPRSIGVRATAVRLTRRAHRAGLRFPAASVGLDQAGQLDAEQLGRTLRRLDLHVPSSAEIATHPGLAADPERNRYRWGYRWADELDALCSPAVRAQIDDAGFVLGTFGDLVSAHG